MTVCADIPQTAVTEDFTLNNRGLEDLFNESETLTEKLSRYVSECAELLKDDDFSRERDECWNVLDQQIPVTKKPETKSTPHLLENEVDKEGDIPDDQLDKQEEGRSDEKETSDDDMKVESEESSEADDSEIELSDQLTEVSDTDSVSEHDSDKESVELEIDDYNFKDCSITRKVNPKTDKIKSKTPLPKELTVAQKTKLYIDQVDKKVSCKHCRSVMGTILHEVRRSESAINYSNIKPYQPKITVITNVRDAVTFQLKYEKEWYAAIMIQRAWRSYCITKLRKIKDFNTRTMMNELRLKYGHIAGFIKKREARKDRCLQSGSYIFSQ